ncbi:MAG: phenylalanine--tRNA ligase subunit beta [Bacteroidales bacterium]|nr:phenylalanine--tRNA ligase subunit beta [Bacteroidales bacterium]
MKISCNWLKEYIPTPLDPVEIGRILTDCGLEVEAFEDFESVKGGLKGVVIGHVLSTSRHPNADKLTCCKVDVGNGQVLDIVCGAPNVAPGQKVPVATVGTVIYKGEESFTIKASKLRGEPSEGMICAEDELGLGDSHAGIMVLDENATIGMPAAEYFSVSTDTVLEVAITPNRSDAASHFGVARDLAAALKNRETQHATIPFTKPLIQWDKVPIGHTKELPISVTIENPEACKRYSGLTLTGLKVQESPAWLKDRLKAVGLRPINNIVDITNFVLMETGQPLHAFDAAEIAGNQVIVKKLPAGTKFITLDGVERTLGADDLMICNSVEGMCIGGVFGGEKSGVTEKTTSIFLESAYFDPTHIRKTSKLHGLKTDASFRFERGTDPNMTIYALQRAAVMMMEIAGGSLSSDIVDVYPVKVENREVEVSIQRMEALIGKAIGRNTIREILESLDIEIMAETAEGFTLAIPPFKVDVEREADVVEEVLRIYGYNNVEMPTAVHSSLSYSHKPDPERVQNLVADFLSANGFNEILTNSLSSSAYYEKSEAFPIDQCVKILNPLSRDLEVMRQTLLFSGLESISYNLNRRQNDLKFYEFGTVYSRNAGQPADAKVTKKFTEKKKLVIYLTGKQENESWYRKEQTVDYTYLKSFVFSVFRKVGLGLWKLQPAEADQRIFSAAEAFTLNSKPLVSMGKLTASVLKSFDIKQDVYYAEIDWLSLLKEVNPENVKYSEVPRFPEVRRDLALLLDQSVTFASVESLAYRVGKGLLKAVNLFDVYEGDKIEAGKKSYAISFILQDTQKTLTDQEVEKMMKRLAESLEKELGAQVRR